MNKIMQALLSISISEKAAFALTVFTAINQAMDAVKGGIDATVDFAYKYLPKKYQELATSDEVKAALKSYVAAYKATEKLFQK
jgi:hypothetical protein